MTGFAVVDCETTGLDPITDRIIECAIILLDEQGVEEGAWSSLVNPRIPVRASFVHGLYDGDVAAAPFFEDIAEQVAALLDGRAFVAHNANFDAGFLETSLRRAGIDFSIPAAQRVCTMELSKIYLPEGRHSLQAAAERAGIEQHPEHRALADAHIAAELLRYYLRAEADGVRYADHAISRSGERTDPASWLSALS
ncbi:MAG: 3'-5' exonuclease [Actinomycetaceae bacterium]|nr:3'-5' exonuclease [Actinomycetaceae bacterium]